MKNGIITMAIVALTLVACKKAETVDTNSDSLNVQMDSLTLEVDTTAAKMDSVEIKMDSLKSEVPAEAITK